MTTIAAVKKNDLTVLATDSCLSIGSFRMPAQDRAEPSKIISGDGFALAMVGAAVNMLVMRAVIDKLGPIPLESRQDVFLYFSQVQSEVGDMFPMVAREVNDDSGYEASFFDQLLLIGPGKIYSVSFERNVEEYYRFMAWGSGMDYAVGAMEALYPTWDAPDIGRRAVEVAAKFDTGSQMPAHLAVFEDAGV